MLIKDLSLELDAKALSAVRGGGVSGTNVGAIVMGPKLEPGRVLRRDLGLVQPPPLEDRDPAQTLGWHHGLRQ